VISLIHVLYIDDECAFLDIGKHYLESEGDITVELAISFSEARDKLASREYDVVVCDHQVRGKSSIRFLEELRSQGNLIPFILLTGKGLEDDITGASGCGAEFYPRKGGDPEALFTELRPRLRQAAVQWKAERDIRGVLQQKADIIDSLPDPTLAIDLKGTVIAWNRAMEEMTGIQALDMVGRGNYEYAIPFYGYRRPVLADLVMKPDEVLEKKYRVFSREGPALVAEASLPDLRGRSVVLWEKAAPLCTGKGEIIGAIESVRDITDRTRAEEALRESGEQLGKAVEDQTELVSWFRPDGTHIFINEAYCRYFGVAPGDVTGHHFMPHIPKEDRAVVRSHLRELTPAYPVATVEHRVIMPDGSIRWQQWSDRAIFDGSGLVVEYRSVGRDITDHKRTEEALRERLEELDVYFSPALDVFCIVDSDGYFQCLNPGWERTLGYSAAELEGRRVLDLVHPDDLAGSLAAMSTLSEKQETLCFISRFRHKDGTYRWIEWRSFPKGPVIYAAVRDITALHRSEEYMARMSALKQELLGSAHLEEKLSHITESIIDIFGAEFARIWIIRPADLCRQGCIHGEVTEGPDACRDRTACLHLVASSGRYTHIDGGHRRVPFGAYKIGRIASGQDTRFITNDVTHDPRVHDHAWAEALGLVSFAGFRLTSPEGRPIGVMAFFSRSPVTPDITGYLEDLATTTSYVIRTGTVEQALRESEERYRTILAFAPTGILVIDGETHRVIDANPKALDITGISREEMIGAVCHRFICPAEYGRCPVTDLGQGWDSSERILLKASGVEVPILKTVVPAAIGGRKVLVESFIDISEQKQAEEALRRSNAQLNLLSRITRHDVANQISIVMGFTELALDRESDPAVAELLGKVEEASRTIGRQIDFTRTYQELGSHAPAWYRLEEIVRNIAPEQVSVSEACAGIEIFADPMLERVFSNLFDNAARHGGSVTAITVTCQTETGSAKIIVGDNGSGIPPSEKEKIFEKGYGRNTGFGLFLAREILGITGIRIRECGEHGKGARFELLVPGPGFRFRSV
jgi:PAS domain S-box-containing protein